MSETVKPTKTRRGNRNTNKQKEPVIKKQVKEEEPVVEPVVSEQVKEEEPVVEPVVDEQVKEENSESVNTPETTKESDLNFVSTLDVDSVPYIEKTIKEAKSVEDIFNNLSKSTMVSSLVNKLKTYRQRMIEKHTEIQGINQQYFMYNTILEILNEKNYGVFNVKFRLLNKVFTLGKDGVFSNIMLSRYDYHWKWGVGTHDTYFKLVSIITTLCDGSKRSINIKTIDFNKGINNLTSTAKQNLIRFYK